MNAVNINTLASNRREFPNWNTRGRVKKVDEAGNVLEGQYAYGGEAVRVSPRYQKNGTNYRVRPERPAVFFSFWCSENGLLPTPLTPEEAESEAGLEILEPLWNVYKHHFAKLESPYAACDQATEPSLKIGFSFNIYQVLVEQIGSVRPTNGASAAPVRPAGSVGGSALEGLKQKIEALRTRNPATATSSLLPPPTKAKK